MVTFKNIITVIAVLLLFVCSVMADSGNETNKNQKEIKQDRLQIRYTVVSLNNISMAVDYWHDATLHGDKKEAKNRLNEIIKLLEDDLKNTTQAVSYAKLELSYSKEEFKKKHPDKVAKFEDKLALKDDMKDMSLENRFLKSKRQILKSIKKSNSFAYQYRLMADYQQLLRNELVLDKVELAEDLGESQKDAGSSRR